MPFTFDYDLARFTPAEAERITGVNTALQRDWRRRGFMPSNEGHARFDVFALAKMLFLQSMAVRGIGPVESSRYADWAMNAIASAALFVPSACNVGEYPGSRDLLARSIVEKCSPLGPHLSRVQSAPVLVIFANGQERYDLSADRAIEWAARTDRAALLCGPVIALDLDVMGEVLADRAGRPLASVVPVDGI